MLYVPTAKLLVVQLAPFVLPVPLSAMALQPLSEVPLALKFTVPVGLFPVTVALKVTLVPCVAGLAELAIVAVVGAVPGELTGL